MLHDQKLTKFHWGEETNTVVYVQNKVPHRKLDNKTPKEVFTGVKSDLSYLCVFGYAVYFHVPKDKMDKLEST